MAIGEATVAAEVITGTTVIAATMDMATVAITDTEVLAATAVTTATGDREATVAVEATTVVATVVEAMVKGMVMAVREVGADPTDKAMLRAAITRARVVIMRPLTAVVTGSVNASSIPTSSKMVTGA